MYPSQLRINQVGPNQKNKIKRQRKSIKANKGCSIGLITIGLETDCTCCSKYRLQWDLCCSTRFVYARFGLMVYALGLY